MIVTVLREAHAWTPMLPGMHRLLHWLDARSPTAISSLALLMLLIIGLGDYLAPPPFNTFVFYTMPIALAAWFAGRAGGLGVALLAAGAWSAKDVVFRGAPYAEPQILLWNTAVRLVMFAIISWLITEVRLNLDRQQQLARTDDLTGLLNARAFADELGQELARADRAGYPVTLAYVDLDDFKLINDRYGHAEGDRALASVGELLRRSVRRSDVLGRLGGDEFAMILPATDLAEARKVLSAVQNGLRAEMARHGWPVTPSIGAITCHRPLPPAGALRQAADRLMYRVKASGKDAVLQRTWNEDALDRSAATPSAG
jgi:diguanylate cyclase (GGDEF)-like protein